VSSTDYYRYESLYYQLQSYTNGSVNKEHNFLPMHDLSHQLNVIPHFKYDIAEAKARPRPW